ncbi:conjugal transfer protein TraG [Methylorubrum thiocyanatum]|uniref:conjugal transfer protein TraG n=1 Tax=Methylorubrum thiocyanatum TaxID=47958 RepID=UPI003F7ECACA
MKWVHAVFIAALALALHLCIVLFAWPGMLRLYPNDPAHTIVYRSFRVMAVALPALFLFAASGIARTGKHGRAVAGVSALFLLGLVGWTAYGEYLRLRPYYPRYSVREILRSVDVPLFCACMFGLFVAFIAPVVSLVRVRRTARGYSKPIRSKTAAYGDAEWAGMKEAGELFPEDGKLPLGERYRVDLDPKATRIFDPSDPKTWGLGGRKPLMGFNCNFGSTHGLIFAGSGGFKTTGAVVPMLLTWPHNAVVLDPSLEVYPMVKDHRTELTPGVQRRIVSIDPRNTKSGFNVLDWIGTGLGSAEEDIAAVTSWMTTGKVSREDPNSFFRNSAQQLLRGLLGHICLHKAFGRPRTLRSLREMISMKEPRFRERLGMILNDEEDGSFAKLALGPFADMTDTTFSGIYSTASEMTDWLSYERYAALVSGGEFQSADLATAEVDVFVCLDIKTLDNHAGLARVIFGALLNALYNCNGAVANRVAFLMDEAARLGHMKIIETARDAGRKYGITMVMVYQSIGQLRDQWGGKDALASWLESTSWQSFSAISDVETAEWLSKRCGSFTQELVSFSQQSRSGGKGSGGSSVSASTSVQKRALILPDDIMSSMRRDEQFLFVAGVEPIRCGRPIYFRRPDMLARTAANRFSQTGKAATDAKAEAAAE